MDLNNRIKRLKQYVNLYDDMIKNGAGDELGEIVFNKIKKYTSSCLVQAGGGKLEILKDKLLTLERMQNEIYLDDITRGLYDANRLVGMIKQGSCAGNREFMKEIIRRLQGILAKF